jgi:hypothetical protein
MHRFFAVVKMNAQLSIPPDSGANICIQPLANLEHLPRRNRQLATACSDYTLSQSLPVIPCNSETILRNIGIIIAGAKPNDKLFSDNIP